MKKNFLWTLLMALYAVFSATAADYGMPEPIQQGNILHCFNWPITTVKAELPNIAAAGFGSVQLSPLQRPDIKDGYAWHDLYRPYDLAFKASPFMGSEQDLRDLCAEAAGYGIKVIVDVVANHVDKTSGYHDPWWDQNNRNRGNVPQSIDYSNRWQVTHHKLGDYYEINSEHTEVIDRGKAYVEFLKDCGVKGIRWDAAKHIGLPSEGCGFWSAVTSVPGMWHYGEILDKPYSGDDGTLIREYASMMSVTDNNYSNGAARNNGGIPSGYGGAWASAVGDNKCVYWGESHDTYSNDEWSQNVDQSVIDRAYAAVACRNGATALYLARPTAKGFSNIKVGKGTDAYRGKAVAEVNKFRNVMVNKADYFTGSGNACSVTRKDGGAVIVMKGSGYVSIANGGNYCPVGTYTDRVGGGTFTVTATTISGNVGSTGIAVIYNDGTQPDPEPDPDPEQGKLYILGNLDGQAGWGDTPGTGVEMTLADGKYTATGVKFIAAGGETMSYLNLTDYVGSTWDGLNASANRYGAATEGVNVEIGSAVSMTEYAKGVNASACKSWTVAPGTYDITVDLSAMTLTLRSEGGIVNPDPEPYPDPDPDHGRLYILGNLAGTAGWGDTPGTGIEMTWVDGKFTATDVTLATTATDGVCYFSFADAVYGSWSDLNASATRYATDTDMAATLGMAMSVKEFHGDCDAWSLPAGTYNFTVDLSAMTMTVVPSAPVYVYYDGNWAPSIYVYDADGKWYIEWNKAEAMTRDTATGYYRYELPPAFYNSFVIFKNGSEQYPGQNQTGLAVSGKSMIFHHSTGIWEEYKNVSTGVGEVTSPSVSVVSRQGAIAVSGLEGETVVVAGIDGRLYHSGAVTGAVEVTVAPGIYVVSVAGHASRLLVR